MESGNIAKKWLGGEWGIFSPDSVEFSEIGMARRNNGACRVDGWEA